MDIYWDYKNRQLVAGLAATQVVTALTMVLRDLQGITLYIVQPVSGSTAYYELVDPPADNTPAFAAKLVLDGDELLTTTNWTRTATGTYTGNIDLESAALITALTSLDSLDITAEFTFVDGTSRNQASSQFVLTILKDVFRAGDGDLLSTASAPNFRNANGNLYFYDPVSELWYPLTIQNQGGIPMFAPGPGVTL
jgi:hypothetical protein